MNKASWIMLRKIHLNRGRLPRFVRRLAPVYGPHFGMAAQAVLRGLGLVYLLSFWSLASQIQGLSGPAGLQPAGAFFQFLKDTFGSSAYFLYPGLGWISQDVGWMLILCGVGALAGIGLLYGLIPWVSGCLAWVCWISMIHLGQPWVSTSSDLLLAEVGFFALWLVPVLSRGYPSMEKMASRIPGILFMNLLLLKLTFLQGWSRLFSGPSSWGTVAGLERYLETQPFPSIGAWWLRLSPDLVLKYLLWGWGYIELMLPWFMFLPRVYRNIFAGAVALKSLFLLSTGHHGVTPWICLLLALSLIDDVSWRTLLPTSLGPPASHSRYQGSWIQVGMVVLFGSLFFLQTVMTSHSLPVPWRWMEGGLAKVHVSQRYMASSKVPSTRLELSLQGSADGQTWVAYPFWMSPGNPSRILPAAQMHSSRLDLAFSGYVESPAFQQGQIPVWLLRLVRGLLQNEPALTALFPANPFPDQPPRFLRLVVMEYRFSSPEERTEKGIWWKTQPRAMIGPVFSLEPGGRKPPQSAPLQSPPSK